MHSALKRSRVVVLVGPRQCGKTTLARVIARTAEWTVKAQVGWRTVRFELDITSGRKFFEAKLGLGLVDIERVHVGVGEGRVGLACYYRL